MKRRISSVKREGGTPATHSHSRKRRRVDPGHGLPAPLPFAPDHPAESSDPGSELRLKGIPSHVTEVDLQQTLEAFFTREEYMECTDNTIVNFNVKILYSNNEIAILTLPYKSLETAYFDSGERITLPGETEWLRVSVSRSPPDAMLVDFLRRTPYISSAAAAATAALVAQLAQPLPVIQLAFGVWTDLPSSAAVVPSFSPEYTADGDTGPRSTTGTISVWYDDGRRAIVVSRIGRPVPLPSDTLNPFQPQLIPRPMIIAPVRNISALRLCHPALSLVIEMRAPVSFENDDPNPQAVYNRVRCTSFDDTHARVSEYASTNLLLRFDSIFTFEKWLDNLKRIPHIPHIPDSQLAFFHIKPAEVFAARWLHTLHKWYEELPLQVALYCEQAVRCGALTPEDMLHCREPIEAAIAQSGMKIAALTVQHLIGVMTSPKFKKLGFSQFGSDAVKAAERVTALHDMLKQAGEKAVIEVRYSARWASPDVAVCHHVFATPTTYIFEPPQRDRSNRVLRKYPNHQHHFLRVTFSEEGGHGQRLRPQMRSPVEWEDFVHQLVGTTLTEGIQVAGRHFEWLGYSSSALKDHQMLFVTPFTLDDDDATVIDAGRIRNEIGIFEEKLMKQPAKFGARIGQAFTATNSSIEIPAEAIELIDDIEHDSYCFTDGVGDMSPELAAEIWSSIKRRRGRNSQKTPPSAFQARFGGCKGVWMVNPNLAGMKIRSRKSQMKYTSDDRGFDVANTSERPTKTYLNRPLVKLLEDLGVPVENLLDLQAQAIEKIERAQDSFDLAAKLLRAHGLGTAFRGPALLNNMSEMLGLDFDASPQSHIDFWKSITMLSITHSLRDIKYRARILVDGPTLIGVCDTFGFLREGQIYVKLMENGVALPALKGNVSVTRSPVIHPGDLQIAYAVGEVPAFSPLSSLFNVVVFSAEGSRPLSSMLGGGDLDGDLFNIMTDPGIRPRRTTDAGDYEPVAPHVLNGPSTMEDIAEFVVDFVINDRVGNISTRHLQIADQSSSGSFDEDCLVLAKLASQAVDFAKSGVPVRHQDIPRARSSMRPDFLVTASDNIERDTYPSMKALGKLFRAVPIQKYERPNEEHRGRVDASVLFKALLETSVRYPEFNLVPPPIDHLKKKWSVALDTFCDLAEKIALRNCPANDNTQKLLEEELFLSTLGTSQRLDYGDSDLMYRARLQISEVVRTLRREIKDLKPHDGEDDGSDDDEHFVPRRPRDARRNQLQKDLRKRLQLQPIYAGADSAHENGTADPVEDQDDDDEVVEIANPFLSGGDPQSSSASKRTVIVVPDSDDSDSDESIVEIEAPDPDEVIIKRAFNACQYALQRLMDSETVPYGLRLFAYVALDVLLSTIRRKTGLNKATKAEGEGSSIQ